MQSRRNKAYFALLGLAATALVVDRVVMTESATSPSAALAELAAGTGDRLPSDKERALAEIPEIPFPHALTTLDVQSPTPDLFAPPDVRRRYGAGGELSGDSKLARVGPRYPERLSVRQFRRRYPLEGVMVHQRLKMAVLRGQPVKPGDSIGGCTLTDVSGLEARFTCYDGVAVLIVVDCGGGSSR